MFEQVWPVFDGVEYRSGGQQGFIVIPKGREGRDRRRCAMSYVSGFSGQALGKGSKAPAPRRRNGKSLSYGEGSAPLVPVGKTYGLSGSASVQEVILPVEVDG